MSFVLFKDSFTDYKIAFFSDATLQQQFQYRYQRIPTDGFTQIVNTGRNGNCIQGGRGSGVWAKTLPHSAEWVTGFAYRIDGSGSGGSDTFYALMNNNANLFQLKQGADGTIQLIAGNVTLIAVSDRALVGGRWYYIEVHVTLSGSTPISCTAELRINGHVEASGTASTGINASGLLSGAANANVHTFTFLSAVGGGNSFCDLYTKNAAGYYGDERVFACYPNSDGPTLTWTPNSGVTHWDRVSTHPVDLTKWLSTATVGNIDLWGFDDCPVFSGAINAVNIRVLAQKTDEGTKSFKIVCANPAGTVLIESQEFFVSNSTPEYYEFSLETDPATGLAWTQSGFNATLWGVHLIS